MVNSASYGFGDSILKVEETNFRSVTREHESFYFKGSCDSSRSLGMSLPPKPTPIRKGAEAIQPKTFAASP